MNFHKTNLKKKMSWLFQNKQSFFFSSFLLSLFLYFFIYCPSAVGWNWGFGTGKNCVCVFGGGQKIFTQKKKTQKCLFGANIMIKTTLNFVKKKRNLLYFSCWRMISFSVINQHLLVWFWDVIHNCISEVMWLTEARGSDHVALTLIRKANWVCIAPAQHWP